MFSGGHVIDQEVSQRFDNSRPDPVAAPTGPPPDAEPGPGPQVIARHLAKLRDGARAILTLLDTRGPGSDGDADPAPPADPSAGGDAAAAADEPHKTPMDLHIERHMALVDRALIQINSLNPGHRKLLETPPAGT